MAKLHTEFTSDASRTEKDYQKLSREAVKLREENRKLAQQSKQGAKEQESAFAGGIAKAGQMVAGIVSVGAAVGVAKGIYTDWRAEIDKLGAASKKLSQQMVHDIIAAGDAAQSGRIESFIGALPGATRDQGRAAYAGVRGALPDASLDQVLELTAETSRAAPLVPDLKAFAGVVGDLADKFPEMAAADTADLALSIQQRAGNKASEATSDAAMRGVGLLTDAGLTDTIQGFAIAIEAAKNDIAESLLTGLATKLGGEIALGKNASAEAKQIAAAPAEFRLGTLLNAGEAAQKEVLGDKLATQLRSIDPAAIRGTAGDLRDDLAGDFLADQKAGLGTSQAGTTTLRQQQLDVEADKAVRTKEQIGKYYTDQNQAIKTQMDAAGDNPVEQWYQQAGQAVFQFADQIFGSPEKQQGWLPQERGDFKVLQNIDANIREQTKLMREQQGIPPTRIEPATQ